MLVVILSGCGGGDGGFAIYRVKDPGAIDQNPVRLQDLSLERVPVLTLDDIATYSRSHHAVQAR